jgi:transcriptional regulator with XRE-family HTH domain
MEFSDQIKSLRAETGLTQEEFARKINVTRQAVSNWENDKNLPDIETLINISTTFNVSLDDLILGGREDMNKMTEKLINDGSETKRAKMNLISTIIGSVFILIGVLCFIIKANSVEYVDKNGILHENFYLLPIGYIFAFAGIMVIVVSFAVYLIKRHNANKK